MPAEPIQVLDGIVRGLVIAGYDFVRLTVAGFIVPFVKRSRHFWRAVVNANKRLSAITFLVVWVVITLSIGFGTSGQVLSSAVGLNRSPDITFSAVIVFSIIISFIIDAILRVCVLRVQCGVKARLYMSLLHIAVASILLNISVFMLCGGELTIIYDIKLPPIFRLIHVATISNWFDHDEFFNLYYPNPIIFLFSASLAIILPKTWSVKRATARLVAGGLIMVAAPTLMMFVFLLPMFAFNWASGDISILLARRYLGTSFATMQRNTTCTFSSDHIDVTTFLRVKDAKSVPINLAGFAVKYNDEPVGRDSGISKGNFAILSADYTRVDLVAAYSQSPHSRLPTEPVSCDLELGAAPIQLEEKELR
jgi:hypothetical protein